MTVAIADSTGMVVVSRWPHMPSSPSRRSFNSMYVVSAEDCAVYSKT